MSNAINAETYPGKSYFFNPDWVGFGRRHAEKLIYVVTLACAVSSPAGAAITGTLLLPAAASKLRFSKMFRVAAGLTGALAVGTALTVTRDVIPRFNAAGVQGIEAAATAIVNNGVRRAQATASYTAPMGLSWSPQTAIRHFDAVRQGLALNAPATVFTLAYSIDRVETGTADCIALVRRPVSPGPVHAVRCWQAQH